MIALLLALGCVTTADPDAAYEVCMTALEAECWCDVESEGRTGADAIERWEFCRSEGPLFERCEDWRENPPDMAWLDQVVTGSADCDAI